MTSHGMACGRRSLLSRILDLKSLKFIALLHQKGTAGIQNTGHRTCDLCFVPACCCRKIWNHIPCLLSDIITSYCLYDKFLVLPVHIHK